jgi:putative transposase
MPRLPRFDIPGHAQHVIQRGVNRDRIFFERQDYDHYLLGLKEVAGTHALDVHAYVLMPNHVHLLMTPHHKGALSRAMQVLGRRYVRYVNRRRERTGTLWEGRFRSTVVEGGEYLLTCQRHIELNPVRTGLVRLPGSYAHSSFRHYVAGEPNGLLIPHPAYLALADTSEERRHAYRALFDEPLDTAIVEELRRGTNHGWAVGGDRFKREIETAARRRATPKPRGGRRPGAGRPRKRG